VQGTGDQFFNLKVVGVTAGQSYLFQPSIFVAPSTWEHVRPQSDAELMDDTPIANIVAVQVEPMVPPSVVQARMMVQVANIEAADLPTTINNIPGYSAQQATVQTQAFFTLLIGILVIGGFFQIQVLQKVPQIGVLKAIGSSNGVVGAASVIQIIVVTAVGVGIGAALTYLFSLVFPPNIPLVFNGARSVLAVLALLMIGPMGGLVSVIYAVRIEPLRALRLQ
jgi:putative ABC transport system permease protein